MLKKMTYAHEHTTIDLSKVKQDPDCYLHDFEGTLAEFKALKAAGVDRIIDVTARGMGRQVAYVEKMARESGLTICHATGFYKEPFLPPEVYELSEKELARLMQGELEKEIEHTGVKAKVIGEIGTGKGGILPIEQKVFRAAARAQQETGAPLSTHTTLGTLGWEQIELLRAAGADLGRVVLGHVDLSQDLDYILRLLEAGVYVAFDTVGKIKYAPDEKRAQMLAELERRGLSERVVLSMDITRQSHLAKHGGPGYSYLLQVFVPLAQQYGVSQAALEQMLVQNPQQLFG